MKHILLTGLLFFTLTKSYGCANEYGYALDGTKIFTKYFYLSERMMHFDTPAILKRLGSLKEKVNLGVADFKTWSDIAANLMKIGRADSSVKILKPLFKQYPEEYNIITNLGTSYELLDELDSALKYISLGFKLNPQSHFGSEWVHVNILQGKIKEKQKPGWMKSNEILNLKNLLHNVDVPNKRKKVSEMNSEIFYQIRTRVQYTPAPNKTMANILTTLGDFNTRVGTYENALLAYTYALQFHESDALRNKVKGKIKILNKLRDANPKLNEIPYEFMQLVKKGKLNPELLLIGLDDFAEKLDSSHLDKISRQDSLTALKKRLDALEKRKFAEGRNQEIVKKEFKTNRYLFLLMGLISGIGITLLVMRLKKKS
jgi:tetratricopeptide (TPR) repeat protein